MINIRRIGLAALGCALLSMVQLTNRAQGDIVAPLPDLTITTVVENGTTAHVMIHNGGALGTNTTFMVRAFEWKNGQWYGAGYKWVNGLAVGASLDVSITAPGIGSSANKYVIDANEHVQESNENNNTYYRIE